MANKFTRCPAGTRYIRAAGKRQAFIFIPTTVGWIEPSKLSMCLHQARVTLHPYVMVPSTAWRISPSIISDGHEPSKKNIKEKTFESRKQGQNGKGAMIHSFRGGVVTRRKP